MRMEAAQIAMQVKEEREMHDKYRQIEEQEEDEIRKSKAFVASVYASRCASSMVVRHISPSLLTRIAYGQRVQSCVT